MISVVIPHYKNREKLYTNLSHNYPFLLGCEIIVVNDNPQTPLKKDLESRYKNVIVVENEKNMGFAGAVSIGIELTNRPYIFLLNDDVVLNDTSYNTALKYFERQKNLFAVSFKQEEKDGSYVGRNAIYWESGFFRHSKGDITTSGVNGWAEGGSMIFEKKKYMEINGFDTVYSPFYWEDIDLSYRAWKAGYEIYFDSEVVVEHHHESTIATYFSKSKINTISYRNQLITIWKNISDRDYTQEHLKYLLKNLILSPIRDGGIFFSGFWMALVHLPTIIKKRSIQKKYWKKSDRDIFTKFKNKVTLP